MTDKPRGDLLQGTLDMLVLKSLQLGAMHGWGITERLELVPSARFRSDRDPSTQRSTDSSARD